MPNTDPKVIERKVMALKKMLEVEVNDRLPRKVGVLAVQHFRQNFREEGFVDGGLRGWTKSKRQLSKVRDASARYKTLTSARNHLMSSIEAHPTRGAVSIRNPVPYARIHNEGGTISSNPTITPKMRKYAWAMYYKTAGRGKKKLKPGDTPEEAKKWLALALTKKTKLQVRAKMPKRQFIGESQELTQKVSQEVTSTLKKITDGISSL